MMRENISLDDGDDLSQIHRRLHHLIVESLPDLQENDERKEEIDAQSLLALPEVVLRTPSGDSSSLKFISKNDVDVAASVSFDNGDEIFVEDIDSITLNDDCLVLRDDEGDVHEFFMEKPNKLWTLILGQETEKFLVGGSNK